jgi:hypothetical protein
MMSFSVGREGRAACHLQMDLSTAQFLSYSPTTLRKGFGDFVSIQGGNMAVGDFRLT